MRWLSSVIKTSRVIGEYRIKEDRVITGPGIEGTDSSEEIQNRQDGSGLTNTSADQKTDIESAAIIEEAEKQAQEIIKKARQQAEEELARARKEGQEKGYQEGYEEGQKEGYRTGLSSLDDSLNTLNEVISRTKEELKKETENLPASIIKTAIRIAGRITATRLEMEPEIINNIVEEMIEEMVDFKEVKIRVNPGLLYHLKQEELSRKFIQQEIEFHADNSLEAGDCIIESRLGGRDGTLENKLALLEKELLERAGFYAGV